MNAGTQHPHSGTQAPHSGGKQGKRHPRKAAKASHHHFLLAGLLTLVLVAGYRVLDARTPENLAQPAPQQQQETPPPAAQVLASLPPEMTGIAGDAPQESTEEAVSGGEEELPIPLAPVEPVLRESFEEVQKGDSILALLMHHNVSRETALKVIETARPMFDLTRRIKPGDPMKMIFDDQNTLMAFHYPVGSGKTLLVELHGEGRYTARLEESSFEPDLPQIVPLARPVADTPVVTASSDLPVKVKNQFSERSVVSEKVQKGDTLATLLARRKIAHTTILDVSSQSATLFDLARSLQPGDKMDLALEADGRLYGLRYPIDTDRTFWLVRNKKGEFIPHVEKKIYDKKLETVSGQVNDSLFASGRKEGLSINLLMNLAGIFEWDIDFARDLREGDSFTVSFESFHHEGKAVREGEIVAARFINQGTIYEAIRYTDPTGRLGYFKPNGQNVRKMFIRAPVDFAHISSLYNLNRKHPVLGYTRAHRGVDYAAPTGTPVRASGDGVIAFMGPRGSFGNLLVIRHNAKYSTAYAHLKGFVKELKVGDRVAQKQHVAYLGSTGISTGPHLHYEVRVDSTAVNPLTVNIPSADPVPKRFMADYLQKSAPLIAALRGMDEVAVLEQETQAYLKMASASALGEQKLLP